MSPEKIGELLNCNHKTIRKYLRLHSIPLRSASEYNYIPRQSHELPTQELLNTPLSLVGHSIYLCEGWHTEKTNCLNFCNTDPILIQLFTKCLQNIYKVNKIRYSIHTNSIDNISVLLEQFPTSKVYIESDRVTPIIRIGCGGKTLARDFISNAYSIALSTIKPGASANFAILA